MAVYRQLTTGERYRIAALVEAGYGCREIGRRIGRSASTISRELRRNNSSNGDVEVMVDVDETTPPDCVASSGYGFTGYDPCFAEQLTDVRRRGKGRVRIPASVWYEVEEKLFLGWSPQQISGRYRYEQECCLVSHETIYQHIYHDSRNGGELYRCLRQARKRRQRRNHRQLRLGNIKNQTMIDHRPRIVDERSRLGDWEIDTVIGAGRRGLLLTVVDRCSRYTLIAPLQTKHSQPLTDTLIKLLKPHPCHTITSDNGKEFSQHETISQQLDTDYFYCHPHSPWQRGTNENTNRLIRQYHPKNLPLHKTTHEQTQQTQHRLNHRPRKTHGYKTPHEIHYNQQTKHTKQHPKTPKVLH